MTLQPGGEQVGLVETALSFPSRMEWDRHDAIEAAPGQARVVERFTKPVAELVAQVQSAAVFKIVHHFADDAAAAIGRDRGLEMEDAIFTIRAGECVRDRALKRLRTFRAKWRAQAGRLIGAGRAKLRARFDHSRTDRAGGRINQTNESAEGIEECRHD